MTDIRLRNRFDFGAQPSWGPESPASTPGTQAESRPRDLPGTYIPDDGVDEVHPVPVNEESRLPQPNQEKTCRICLSGAEDGILFPSYLCTYFVGRLISPCRCRGTMKFVHLTCLNSWRYASPNERSVYQCDQCGYRYNFTRTKYAAIVGSIYTRVCAVISSLLIVDIFHRHRIRFRCFYLGLRFQTHPLFNWRISSIYKNLLYP